MNITFEIDTKGPIRHATIWITDGSPEDMEIAANGIINEYAKTGTVYMRLKPTTEKQQDFSRELDSIITKARFAIGPGSPRIVTLTNDQKDPTSRLSPSTESAKDSTRS